MKTILIPLDFSPESLKAVRLGFAIAQKTSATVVLHYCYTVNIPPGSNLHAYERKLAEMEEKYSERLHQVAATHQLIDHHTGNPVEYEIIVTKTRTNHIKDIIELAEKRKIFLLVMSAKSTSGFTELFSKTGSLSITQTVYCPVLLVPHHSNFDGNIDHIVFALNLDADDTFVLGSMLNFAEYFDAEIECLHVNADRSQEEKEQQLGKFKTMIQPHPMAIRTSYKIINDKNIAKAVENHVITHATDILVMVMHERNQSIFSKSATAKVASRVPVAMLIIHKDENAIISPPQW